MNLARPCPLCSHQNADSLVAFTPVWFDAPQPLSPTRIVSCGNCGFVFCDTQHDGAFYASYYSDRAQNNPGTGMGSGLSSRWDAEHYQRVYDIIADSVAPTACLVDVGCGRGGFLKFLREHGFSNLHGADLDQGNVEHVAKVEQIDCIAGSAAALPHSGADALVYNFIFEHLFDIRGVVRCARQSLAAGGLVFVEVPDVMAFSSHPIFPFYHFALFEHLNYFSDDTLAKTFTDEGFEVVRTGTNVYHMADHVLNPMVWGVFRKTDQPAIRGYARSNSRTGAEAYIVQSQANLKEARRHIAELVASQQPLFVWGGCVELFALVSHTELLACNIRCIVDNNPEKQTKTVHGIPIKGSHVLADAAEDSVLFIISTIHHAEMLAESHAMGYAGQVLDISQCALGAPQTPP